MAEETTSMAPAAETDAAAPEPLPPLNAGDREPGYPTLSIDEEPEDAPEETAETSEETPAETADENDDELLNLMRKEAGEEEEEAPAEALAGKPQEVSQEEWDAFQKFRQEQQTTNAAPAAASGPAAPADFEITPEDFDAAFEDVDKFKGVMGKVQAATEHRINEAFKSQMNIFKTNITAQIEQMIYLNEAVRDTPEILNYPDAFRVAYTKAMQTAKQGDLRTPVMEAVERLKREMGRLEAIKGTKKVDVRPKQQAPKQAKGSGRQAHGKSKPDPAEDGISFLRALS